MNPWKTIELVLQHGARLATVNLRGISAWKDRLSHRAVLISYGQKQTKVASCRRTGGLSER
jgi:hypothetical protein